jgi:spore photoproduct lyase
MEQTLSSRQQLVATFDKVWIDERSRGSALAERILQIFPTEKIEFTTSAPGEKHRGPLSAEQFNQSKRLLSIRPFEGLFFKRCPGASQKKVLNCCNYHVLNLGQQCNMNCSYCYLQSYLNSPTMVMYSNIDQALRELDEMASLHGNLPFRVGTGEVIDSLSLDEITLFSRDLIAFFRKYPKWTLEFKTKSQQVDQFLDCEHAGNVVVSWSLNASEIIEAEEHGTARLQQRLQAARKVKDRGFQVAFHLDPLIWYPNWKAGYADLIEQITSLFSPEEINVLSLGALRFQPEQRHMMRERFGMKSYVTSSEMFPSEGNKLRYDSKLRREMFDFVLAELKARAPSPEKSYRSFLCMETPESWISSYENNPMQMGELKELFRPLPRLNSELSAIRRPGE